ncbi:MAG TPA: ergothioneine biosynthesis protein EgtB [Tepidisphaeraceae bacterium]|nr:ergothioneine biosynthesis protein EgtB [Tepidisphaeraceae bacterium]
MDDRSATVASPRRREAAEEPWIERYRGVRGQTEVLCAPLVAEDYVVQSMPDVSPTKWHLAHTSWFFETFLLSPHARGYELFDPHFAYLFNSYYVAVGDRHCRQNRGLLSRPTVAHVYAYRKHVDEAMERFLGSLGPAQLAELKPVIELGLHHEQQHQELMLTDIKHVFWVNPLRPAYLPQPAPAPIQLPPMRWIDVEEGIHWIGHEGSEFAFDNETPRHRVFLDSFRLASRLVTNGEYKQFMADGGYRRADLWLSLGWATVQAEQWNAPLYWMEQDGAWQYHTLSGMRPVEDDEPVCHVSYFEADAYARWAGARLPSEFEWEAASMSAPIEGSFVESRSFHPQPLGTSTREGEAPAEPGANFPREQRLGGGLALPDLNQMFGDVWEWTRSAYLAYPGYQPAVGALGEYNGKFMCNQFVLRGGSCATPRDHIRRTYRNFFAPESRWQFMGFRLAQDV